MGSSFCGAEPLQQMHQVNKPIFVGLGRYDYLVAPISLWDAVDPIPHVKKVIFEKVVIILCLKNLYF